MKNSLETALSGLASLLIVSAAMASLVAVPPASPVPADVAALTLPDLA